jgi:hypothetical protein
MAPLAPNYLVTPQIRTLFSSVVEEWLQHHYQFYRIQSLDIVQMPRMPEMDASFMAGILSPQFAVSDFPLLGPLVARLTNRADAVSQAVWERMTPQGRTALEQSGGGPSAGPVLTDELNTITRAGLSMILPGSPA